MTFSAETRLGKDAGIRYALGDCSLGMVLVAESPVGICAISLGDDAIALKRELLQRFPNAQIAGNNEEIKPILAKVRNLIDKPETEFDLPLDLRGTAFQQQVWSALRNVPPGSTITYSELARRIGAPKSIRAVAGACAANVLAVAIPCHRAVRKDGSLSGYRWGIGRKAELLRREKG